MRRSDRIHRLRGVALNAAIYAVELYEKCALERIQLRADRKALAEALDEFMGAAELTVSAWDQDEVWIKYNAALKDARAVLRDHGGEP